MNILAISHRFPSIFIYLYSMRRSNTLVILPTYNELNTLAGIVSRIRLSSDASVLIVDDSSPDGTGELADQLASSDSDIYVMHRSGKLGLGTAYIAGFEWGVSNKFNYLIEMDSDGSHPVEMLDSMIQLLDKNDLVIGSRYVLGGSVENWNRSRRALSKYANIYSRLLLGGRIRDMTSGFRGMRADKISAYLASKPNGKGFAFQIEMSAFAHQQNWKVNEFPINFIERLDGASKMSLAIKLEAFSFVTIEGLKILFNFG